MCDETRGEGTRLEGTRLEGTGLESTGLEGAGVALLEARSLTKLYRRPNGQRVRALDGVDLTLFQGSTLALVGESGSGKSTLASCLALLEESDGGEIRYRGESLQGLDPRRRRELRRRFQLVAQDPAAAIQPRFSLAEAVEEPLLLRRLPRSERRRQAARWLAEVSLPGELLVRNVAALSGGQRRRAGLARALAAEPEVLILDETLSGLDLSHQAQLANLLRELQERHTLTYLLISHDLRIASWLADRVAVLDRGRLVEVAPPAELLRSPRHPATKAFVGVRGLS